MLQPRSLLLALLYALMTLAAVGVAYVLRFDFDFGEVAKYAGDGKTAIAIVVAVQIASLFMFNQFRSFLRFFYMRDMVLLLWSQTIAYAVAAILILALVGNMPRSVIVLSFILNVAFMLAFRVGLRWLNERVFEEKSREKDAVVSRSRVAVIGAGNLGSALVSDLMAKLHLGVVPVVFFDDDPEKIGKQISGLEVEKIPENFEEARRRYTIDKAIVATSKIEPSRLGMLASALRRAGIEVLIQPSYFDFISGRTKLAPIREINILDVLNRRQVDLDDDFIGESLVGKTVMVTGAGGSIGGELCRQIAMRKASTIVLVEQCEVQMFKIQQDLLDGKYGVEIKTCIADVCDAARMEHIISRTNPDIIFHAAAHKHVPMMEAQPGEALKNNVLGTWTVADLASRYGIKKFLLISTDKAVNPTNVMGATKRFAELVVQSMQSRDGNRTKFVAVRFGNVLGSSGSVIPTFKKQIAAGGPVTITHPEVTRFFMTIPEAVGLVLQCAAQADGGEIFVLDMGDPVKIIDLARRMITLSGFEPDRDIQIEVIGLRPGEKLYEELQNRDERNVRTEHERIMCFCSTPEKYGDVYANVAKIRGIADSKNVNDLKRFLGKVVPEYKIQYYD